MRQAVDDQLSKSIPVVAIKTDLRTYVSKNCFIDGESVRATIGARLDREWRTLFAVRR